MDRPGSRHRRGDRRWLAILEGQRSVCFDMGRQAWTRSSHWERLAALGVSAVEAIALGGRHVHLGGGGAFAARLHGVMAPLIVSILATGRAIEMRARARAAEAMHSLLSLRPPSARVVLSIEDEDGVSGSAGESSRRSPHPGPAR